MSEGKKPLQWENFEHMFGDWAQKIYPFFVTGQMDKIYDVLKADSRRGIKSAPHHTNVWKAFEKCPLADLKCVFLGLAPYATFKDDKPIADGLAFSCGITHEEQPSLKLMWDAVFDDLGYEGKRYTDLSHWAHQGVLLINIALTAKKRKPESHLKLWEDFIIFLFEEILNLQTGIPIIYFGDQAATYIKKSADYIHYNKKVEHPAHAARQERAFKHENIFSWINKILKEQKRDPINWIVSQEEYKRITEQNNCPF